MASDSRDDAAVNGDSLQIRPARAEDAGVIADFNCRLARETESLTLDPVTVLEGVRAVLRADRRGRYLVAELDRQVVGQVMVTWEWSDWRNGNFYWVQSVYVHPSYRRRGVFTSLWNELERLVASDPEAIGLRLYVEHENTVAKAVYGQLGLTATGYEVLERLRAR